MRAGEDLTVLADSAATTSALRVDAQDDEVTSQISLPSGFDPSEFIDAEPEKEASKTAECKVPNAAAVPNRSATGHSFIMSRIFWSDDGTLWWRLSGVKKRAPFCSSGVPALAAVFVRIECRSVGWYFTRVDLYFLR